MSERPRESGFMAVHAAAPLRIGMKQAAERAPIWVIAIMAHVLVAAVLGMLYVRHEANADEDEGLTFITTSPAPEPMLEDPPELPPVIHLPRMVPEDPGIPDGITWVTEPNPFTADPILKPVVPDGTNAASEVMTESDGGIRKSGSIGSGSGTGPGAGAPRGVPFGRSPRVIRISQQADLSKQAPVIKGGLRWLREHQSEDGMWDCDGFSLRCDPKLGPACTGRGSATFDVGVTGLALLAFLGAGYDGRGRTLNDECVRAGLKCLRNSQDAEGCFGPRGDNRFTYSHACATIAMCEAATFNKAPVWRKSAQQAIDFVQSCQNPYKGWRYGIRPGESDASVTGWMLLALKAGKDAGLVVNERAIRGGLVFLDSLTDPTTGRTGYLKPGELPVRPVGFVDRWPARESEALTAVALCSRIFLGREEGNALTKAGAALLSKSPPLWDESRGSIDMYYWYYGTLAMHQLGGAGWDQWNKALDKAVIQSQITEGCTEGSWDPKDPWGDEGGRVYSTALMTLSFQVYWRYPLVFGGRK